MNPEKPYMNVPSPISWLQHTNTQTHTVLLLIRSPIFLPFILDSFQFSFFIFFSPFLSLAAPIVVVGVVVVVGSFRSANLISTS